MSYADAFTYDGTNGYTPHDVAGNAITTLAYPTTVTDADGHSSSIKYNYDFGATTRTQNPLGAAQTVTYDGAGRVDRVTTGDAGAYRKYLYYSSWFATVDTINQAADEAVNFNSIDGLGRVWMNIAYAASGGTETRAQWTIYDVMGRPAQQSNPAVIDGSWTPIGDDAAGWIFTQQTYDWKGRPLRTIHPDGYYTELSYTGCGCAGGEVVTATDENNLARRTTYDVLGRLIKSEELNPPDPNTGVRSTYSAANYVYNALDQVTTITHEGQTRSFSYDGYGRLSQRITPEQGTTTYAYNADDTLQSIPDARGAVSSYVYTIAIYRRILTIP